MIFCVIGTTNFNNGVLNFSGLGATSSLNIVNNTSNEMRLNNNISVPADVDIILEGDMRISGNIQMESADATLTMLNGNFDVTGGVQVSGAELTMSGVDFNANGNFQISGANATVTMSNSDVNIQNNFQVSGAGATVTGGSNTADCALLTVGNTSQAAGANTVFGGTTHLDLCDGGGTCGFDQVVGSNFDCGANVTNCSCTPTLPIELIKFYTLSENDIIQLFWVTATEDNNDFFYNSKI